MIFIVSGTDRENSNTLQISKIIEQEYKNQNIDCKIIDLRDLPFNELHFVSYTKEIPPKIAESIEWLNGADGIHFVVPEYNGSYPGILKYYIDHFIYPTTFEHRPIAFTGLGWRWGGLRPVEHLQGVFGYRNAYMFPQRVFISNIGNVLKDGELVDGQVQDLLKLQVKSFHKFIKALKSEGLDANSMIAKSTNK